MPDAATPPASNAPPASGTPAAGAPGTAPTGVVAAPAVGTPPPAAAGAAPAAGAPGQTQPGAPAAGTPPPAAPEAPKPLELALPANSPLSKEHVEAIKTWATDKKIPAEAAQAILERDHAQVLAQNAKWIEDVKTFEAQVRADPDLGGQKYDATIASATKALKQFARPDFIEVLDKTGLGSYPGFIAFCAAVAKFTAEPGHQQVNAPAPSRPKSLADFYENPK